MPETITLITGANRGIGRELAAQLADRGHTSVLAARSHADATTAAADLIGARPDRAVVPVALDVTDAASISSAVEAVHEQFGRIDVLVNNAAIHFDASQSATDADLQMVEEALQTNLIGSWRVTQALLPLLRRGHTRRIVNVSSEQASLERMGARVPAYKTSKAALNALTRILAAELAEDGFTVHAASPGWTATDMGGKGGRPIPDGARSIREVIELPNGTDTDTDTDTDQFYQDGATLPW